eukprot:2344853-Rhodomonas_salina.2
MCGTDLAYRRAVGVSGYERDGGVCRARWGSGVDREGRSQGAAGQSGTGGFFCLVGQRQCGACACMAGHGM